MVKVVIDANVFISAAFGGIPLDAVSKAFSTGKVFLSLDTAAEIETAIGRLSPKLGSERTKILFSLWERLRSYCEISGPVRRVSLCRHPKDDAYLGLCATVGADYLITGDKDLLSVNQNNMPDILKKLKILTPREFLESVG